MVVELDSAPGTDSPYRLRWAVDLPLLGLGAAGTLAVTTPVAPPACLPECEPPSDLNALDALVVGNYSEMAHTIASVAVLALVALPLLVDAVLGRGRGFGRFVVIYLQGLAAAAATVQLVKFAVDRAAPLVYATPLPEAATTSADAARSFLSGHTATAAVCVTFAIGSWWIRRPAASYRGVVVALAIGVVGAVAGLKIVAGYHYFSDVVAGALVGTSFGVLGLVWHRGGTGQ